MPVSSRSRRFWNRMVQSWGTRVADLYGPTCPQDWQDVINRTDDDRLDQALVALRQATPVHPPALGQFEAAIPKRAFGQAQESIPDRLAQHAVKTTNLCEHQSMSPWNYFGQVVDEWYEPWGETRKGYVTKGVVVPACSGCQKPSHRLTVTDLPA